MYLKSLCDGRKKLSILIDHPPIPDDARHSSAVGTMKPLVANQAMSSVPARLQCDVPSERVILLNTLYLPTGFFIGRRFTSLNVAAS